MSDRKVIRLQVWGQEHPLYHHLGYAGPSAAVPAVPPAHLPWCTGSAWDPGLWPVGLPDPWEKRLTTLTLPAPLPTWEGRRGLLAHTCSGSPWRLQPLGTGVRGCRGPVLCVGWSPQPLPVTWLSM